MSLPNSNEILHMGRELRRRRRALGLTQAELAALCNVGNRFVSELENGKPSLEIGRVLKVLEAVGLGLTLRPRDWERIDAPR